MVLELERCDSSFGMWAVEEELDSLSQPSLTNTTRLSGVGQADEAALAELVDGEVLKGMVADPWMGGDDTCARLLPLKTPSDHNCLCHAMALALWGRQDKDCMLRDGIARAMEADTEAARYFKEQWMHAILERDTLAFGVEIQRSPEEWVREWQEELVLAKDLNCSLTEIHVLVLAHIVRRPVIIYSPRFCKDVNGTAFAPIYFAGVYLPVLHSPEQCAAHSPVLLTYSQSHFSPLIPCPAGNRDPFAPLVDAEGKYLPVQFVDQTLFAPGEDSWRGLLQKYMPVEQPEGQPHYSVGLSMQHQFFLDGRPAPECERFFAGRQSPPRRPLSLHRPSSALRVETEATETASLSSRQSSVDPTLLEEPLSPDSKCRVAQPIPKSAFGSLAQKRSFALPGGKLGGPPASAYVASKFSPQPQRPNPAKTLDSMRRCTSLRNFPGRAASALKPEPPAEEAAPPVLRAVTAAATDAPPSYGASTGQPTATPGRLTSRPKVGIVRRLPGDPPVSPPSPAPAGRSPSPASPSAGARPAPRPASPTAAGARSASPFPQRGLSTGSSASAGQSPIVSPSGSPVVVSPTFAAARTTHGLPPRIRPISPIAFPEAVPARRAASPPRPLRAPGLPAALTPERGSTSPSRPPRALSPRRRPEEDAPPIQSLPQSSPRQDRSANTDMPVPQKPNTEPGDFMPLRVSPPPLEKRARSFIRADPVPTSNRKSPPQLQSPARSPRPTAATPEPARMP